jgi:hypothetical protein
VPLACSAPASRLLSATGEDGEAAGAGRRGWPAMRARVAGDVGRGGFFFFLYLGGGLRRTFVW